MVVSIEGKNVEIGKKIIKERGMKVIQEEDIEDEEKKIVDEVKGN